MFKFGGGMLVLLCDAVGQRLFDMHMLICIG